MLQRIVSGVVALAIVLPVLFFGGVDGAKALVGLVLFVVLYEFGPVASPERPRAAFGAMSLVGGGIYALMSWGGSQSSLIGVAMVLGVAILLTWSMFAHEDPEEGALSGAVTAISVSYIAAAMAFIGLVRGFQPDGLQWLLYVLIATWATDTGAYFAGRFFGKTKLIERISPKKTWEGAIGGLVLSVVGALVIRSLDPALSPGGIERVAWHHIAALGALIHVSGVVGDLVESLFKRAHGIKDSGWIMPGHGGILDRMDSIIFTAPVTWIYASYFGLG